MADTAWMGAEEMAGAPPAAPPVEPISFVPGIYFGLPEEEYHAARALSSSGIRNLLISPLEYWVNSHLNPEYQDEKTPAMIAGTAFHRRLLEPARYARLYAKTPAKSDYPDAIDGMEGLRAECERLDLKKSGRISDICQRILDVNPTARLWPVIEQGLLAEAEGKILLTPAVSADIERAAKLVFAHPSAAKAMTGGLAEVSIFWIDEESGVPMKIRTDYLKTRAVVDLKTFSNPLSKPVDIAIANAVANHLYNVQGAVYMDGVEQAKRMLRRMKLDAIHNVSGEELDPEWIKAFASCVEHAFVFVFIQQGAVTNVRVREFRKSEPSSRGAPSANMYWQAGWDGYRKGVSRYYHCMKKFGPDRPWIDDAPMTPFVDQDFPLYMFN